MRYRARKVDANQAAIVTTLKEYGCVVVDLSGVGKGCPDLLVLAPNRLHGELMEVKNKAGRGDKLTPAQVKFHGEWFGRIHRVTSPAEAVESIFPVVER